MDCTKGHEKRCQKARYIGCHCACDGDNHGGTEKRVVSTTIRQAIKRGRSQGLQKKFMLGWSGLLYEEPKKRRMPVIARNEEPMQFCLLDQEAETEEVADPSEEEGWKATRGMKLLTKEILKKLPPIGGQEKAGEDAIVHVKLFAPDSSWTFYVTEFDPITGQCFGLVDGFEKEIGYFSLPELMEVRGPMGLAVERDKWWKPCKLKELM